MTGIDASEVENIARRLLLDPEALAGGQIKGKDRVGAVSCRVDVRVARTYVERATLRINRGCVPDGRACGAELRMACAVFRWPRDLGESVGLPDLFSRQRIHRDHATAECAAGIVRVAAA